MGQLFRKLAKRNIAKAATIVSLMVGSLQTGSAEQLDPQSNNASTGIELLSSQETNLRTDKPIPENTQEAPNYQASEDALESDRLKNNTTYDETVSENHSEVQEYIHAINKLKRNFQVRKEMMSKINGYLVKNRIAGVKISGSGTTSNDPLVVPNCQMFQFIEVQKNMADGSAIKFGPAARSKGISGLRFYKQNNYILEVDQYTDFLEANDGDQMDDKGSFVIMQEKGELRDFFGHKLIKKDGLLLSLDVYNKFLQKPDGSSIRTGIETYFKRYGRILTQHENEALDAFIAAKNGGPNAEAAVNKLAHMGISLNSLIEKPQSDSYGGLFDLFKWGASQVGTAAFYAGKVATYCVGAGINAVRKMLPF